MPAVAPPSPLPIQQAINVTLALAHALLAYTHQPLRVQVVLLAIYTFHPITLACWSVLIPILITVAPAHPASILVPTAPQP
jgi:hypothetical protein